ncbi:MAG: carboxypeptidase-like regulatory domain-containing protein [Thermodesulfobacteriota bacterium]
MMKGVLKLFGIFFLSLSLFACGGGGGGGGVVAPTATVTGTVTDSTLEPVAGVSVTVQGGSTTQTDAAGRYTLSGISAIAHQISFSPPANKYFPAAATVVCVGGKTTVLDIFLARGEGVALADADLGGTITSPTYINAVQDSTFVLTATDVKDSTGADYIGDATVYVAPIDVGKPGHGLASYQSNLGNVFTALTGSPSSTSTIEIFGAAAVAIEDPAATPLALVAAGSTSTLELPIPDSPADVIRLTAPQPTASLWYYDESVGALVEHANLATYNVGTVSGPYYEATIDRTGLWLAGVEHLTPTIINGTLLFSNNAAAAGATIYAAGDDHGFTHITSTDASGSFSFPAKSGSDLTLHFVVSANGAQWPHEISLTGLNAANAAMGNIDLPFAPPVVGAAAQATITVDDRDIAGGGNAPDVLGYVLSSGRQLSDPDSADDSTARNIGNVVFVASSLAEFDPITVDPSLNGSAIQVIAGQTFGTLSSVPTIGYIADKVNLDPAVTTFPVLLAVQTDKGHYGKISIDSVTSLDLNNNEWRITFRHAFSLTNTF